MNSTPSPTFATSWENINPIPAAAAASAALSSAGYTFFLFLLDDTFLFRFVAIVSRPLLIRGLPMTMSFAVCVFIAFLPSEEGHQRAD